MSVFRFLFCCLLLGLTACASAPGKPKVVNKGLTQPLPAPPYHQVVAGDTLYSIALRYDRDYNELAEINHLPADYRILAGQKLLLDPPKAGSVVVASPPKPVQPPVAVASKSPQAAKPVVVKPAAPALKPEKPLPARPEVSKPVVAKPGVSKTDVAKTEIHQPDATKPSPDAGTPVPVEPAAKPSVGPIAAPTGAPVKNDALSTWTWPAKGAVIARFSENGVGNKGLDIAGRRGDAVQAAGDGTVVYVGSSLVGYGKLIIIRHNNNYLSAYAHNDRFLVKEGERVKLGQTIAEMGSSGADREKLHFEIRRQGKPVDPLQFLPPR